MKLAFFLWICPLLFASIRDDFERLAFEQKIVVATKQIVLEDFPDSYNPSIIKTDYGILLSFRYAPDRYSNPWLSYIGVVLLNEDFEPISKPQLVNTRALNNRTQSQSEDARLFAYRGRVFLIYTDNMEISYTSYNDRKDMHMVELFYKNGMFSISAPLKLYHQDKQHIPWQKNWVPFEWNKKLLVCYSVNPHEILYVNLQNGACYSCYETQGLLDWEFGTLRGSAPPQLVDGEYLSFFHSGTVLTSESSWGWELWHYFTGAYTFSPNPPFQMTAFTPEPIVGADFYVRSLHEKRVIFPGGFFFEDPYIYMAYGKDDYEIWVATIDKNELKKALKPVASEE